LQLQQQEDLHGTLGWWSIVPPVLTIILALATKDVVLSLFLGLSGTLIASGGNLFAAAMLFGDKLVEKPGRRLEPADLPVLRAAGGAGGTDGEGGVLAGVRRLGRRARQDAHGHPAGHVAVRRAGVHRRLFQLAGGGHGDAAGERPDEDFAREAGLHPRFDGGPGVHPGAGVHVGGHGDELHARGGGLRKAGR
jgi:hypothetical protein